MRLPENFPISLQLSLLGGSEFRSLCQLDEDSLDRPMQQNPVPFLDREQETLAPQLETLYVLSVNLRHNSLASSSTVTVGSPAYPALWAKYLPMGYSRILCLCESLLLSTLKIVFPSFVSPIYFLRASSCESDTSPSSTVSFCRTFSPSSATLPSSNHM